MFTSQDTDIVRSGLDNAGKTTILKKINNEDVLSVSPTLGFNIKTFMHGRSVGQPSLPSPSDPLVGRYTLNICQS